VPHSIQCILSLDSLSHFLVHSRKAFESLSPAQHAVPPERMLSALRFRLATPSRVLHLRRKMLRLHFAGKMFQTRMGSGSRCCEFRRPTTDVYSQSFEQRERFASPTNTQNSSGSTTTQL